MAGPANRKPSGPGATKRPAARSKAATGPAREPARAALTNRKPRLTSRAAILLLVAAVLVISYASSMRAYLNQRAHIADTQARIAAAKANIEALEKEKRRWADPAYVEAQARGRLGWVLPGEVGYQVIGRDGKPLGSNDVLDDPASVVPLNHTPVWTKLYQSVRITDHPPTTADPDVKITPKNP